MDEKRSSGRPRSAEADRAILAAARRLLAEQGYARMSMEGVAAEAGVGKTTIYRRYLSKQELVVAVIEHFVPVADLPRIGNARTELLTVAQRVFPVITGTGGVGLIGTLLAEEATNPALLEFFRERVMYPRMQIGRGILERGIARGEVRPDADLEAALHMLIGSLLARELSNLPRPADWPERVVETIWRAIGTEPADSASDEAGT